jgi:hypothetical protein
MGPYRSEGLKEERTLTMHDMNRDGRERHSDNVGSRLATEITPVISGLTESTRNFPAAVRGILC